MVVQAVSRKNRNQVRAEQSSGELPSWVRDNLVLKLLDELGLNVEVMYDLKYLNGLSNKPLVIIRGKQRLGQVKLRGG